MAGAISTEPREIGPIVAPIAIMCPCFAKLARMRCSFVASSDTYYPCHAVFCSLKPSSLTVSSRIKNFCTLPVTVMGKLSTNLM